MKKLIAIILTLTLLFTMVGCSASKPAGSWAREHNLKFEKGQDISVPTLAIGTDYYKKPYGEDIIKFYQVDSTYQFVAAERTKEKKDGSITYKFVVRANLGYMSQSVDAGTVENGNLWVYTLAENIHVVDLYTGFVYPTDSVGRVEYSQSTFNNEWKGDTYTISYICEVEYKPVDAYAVRNDDGTLTVEGNDAYELEITLNASDGYKGLGLFLPKAGATDPEMFNAEKGYIGMQFEEMDGFTSYDDYYFWGCHDMTDRFVSIKKNKYKDMEKENQQNGN